MSSGETPPPGLGLPRLHLRRTDSTNTRARELAAGGAPHGTLVSAAEQTSGRGRQGRSWSAPAGRALLCSLVIREPPRLLALAAGVAVAELAGPQFQVKWPNDVVIDGRKLAGILVEGRPQESWAVLGIGINVAVRIEELAPELQARAATLGLEPDAVEPMLARLLTSLGSWIAAPESAVLEALRGRDALRGSQVRWAAGEGRADGIDEDGRLLVQSGQGRHALEAGEVHLVAASR